MSYNTNLIKVLGVDELVNVIPDMFLIKNISKLRPN